MSDAGPADRAQALMRAIGARALSSNLRRVDELTVAVGLATAEGGLPALSRDAAVGTAHQLAGSAGTFGYDRVSQLARRVESFLVEQSFTDDQRCAAATQELVLMRMDLLAGPDEDALS